MDIKLKNIIRRIALGVCAAAVVVCIVLLGVFLGAPQKSKNDLNLPIDDKNNSASTAAGSLSGGNYSFEGWILDVPNADKAVAWNEAISKSGTVIITLNADWEADATGSFGTGAGFSSGALCIPAGKKVVLNLNGYNIDRKLTSARADGHVIKVESTAELEIVGSGKITGGNSSADGGGILNNGSLTLTGGNVYKNSTACNGGGVYSSAGSELLVQGGTVEENYSLDNGGGIYVEANTFTMTSGIITKNVAEKTVAYGGGIHIKNVSTTSAISGGEITYNESFEGGGIYTESSLNLTAKVSNNEAQVSGGGVYINGTIFQFYNGSISNNKAGLSGTVTGGGGVFVKNGGTMRMFNGEISNNSSPSTGAVTMRNGTFEMSNGKIANNTACTAGLDSYPTAGSTYNLTGGFISGNVIGFKSNASDTINIGLNTAESIGMNITGNNTANLYLEAGKLLNIKACLHQVMIETYIGITSSSPSNNLKITTGYKTTSNRTNGYYTFFSDHSNYRTTYTSNEIYLISGSSNPLTWDYVVNGVSKSTTKSYVECEYGDEITEVSVTYNVSGGGTQTCLWDENMSDTTQGTVNHIAAYYQAPDNDLSKQEERFSHSLKKVGSYYFIMHSGNMGNGDRNLKLALVIKPKNIEVTIKDNLTSKYGDPIQNAVANDDTKIDTIEGTTYDITSGSLVSPTDLNGALEFKKDIGYNVGEYRITGSYTGENYNVTFVDGKYTITKIDVSVKLFDQQVTFGSKYYTLNNKLNTAMDNNGTPSDTSDDFYNGGWQYEDSSPNQFIASDLTNMSRYPLRALCKAGTVDISDTSNTAYINSGDYIVTYNALSNYNVTFSSSNTLVGGSPVNNNQTVLKVKKAQIVVDPDNTLGYKTEISIASVSSSGETIAIPVANIKLKGGMSASTAGTMTYEYTGTVYNLSDTNVTVPAKPEYDKDNNVWEIITDATTTPPTKATVTWMSTTGAQDLTKKDAGEYKVYFKLSAANHEDLVQEWTLKIKAQSAGTVVLQLQKDTSVPPSTTPVWTAVAAGVNPVYGDKVRVDIDYSSLTLPSGVTSVSNFKVYYKGTNTGNTYGAWDAATDQDPNDANNKISIVDSTKHKDYGTTTAPTGAGSYTATFVPSTGNVDLGNNQAKAFTIDKVKVGGTGTGAIKLPKDGSTPANKTYNGLEQTFTVSDYDSEVFKLGTLPDGMTDKNNSFTTAGATVFTLEATNAGDYKVPVKLKDEANYEWDSSVTVKTDTTVTPNEKYWELELKIAKVKVGVTFGHPSGNTTGISWTWKPGTYPTTSGGTDKYITYKITESTLIEDQSSTNTPKDKEKVGLKLYWCQQPASGSAATPLTTNISVDSATQLEVLDVSGITKGKYYAYVALDTDTTTYPANVNYEIEVDTTSKLPTTYKQNFEVTDGSADLNGLNWKYGYTKDGTPYTDQAYVTGSKKDDPNNQGTQIPAPELDTHIVYGLNADKSVVEFTFELDTSTTNGFPTYLEIDTNPPAGASALLPSGVNFNVAGYAQQKYGTAGKHVTYVAVKIKSGEEVKFESTGTSYKYVDDTHAVVEFEWEIEQFEIKPADYVKLGYVVDENGTQTAFKEFNKVNDGTAAAPIWVYEVDVQGVNQIIPQIQIPANFAAMPYDLTAVLNQLSMSGSGVNGDIVDAVTPTGQTLNTTVSFSLKDTVNYKLAASPDNVVKIVWRVTVATLDVTDAWSSPQDVTGTVKDADGNSVSVTLKTPKITSGDSDIDSKIEYVYEYTLPGDSTPTKFKGLQGLYELNKKADELNGGAGGLLTGVTVKVEPKTGYKLPSGTFATTITVGDSRRRVSVVADGPLSGTYKSMDITFTVTRKDNNSALADSLYKMYIYMTDDASKIDANTEKKELTPDNLNALNSGKYVVGIELTNTTNYMVLAGQERFTVTVNKIELDIPTLVSNPIFNGGEQDVTELFDEGYASIKDLVEVTGQNAARNKGNYTLVVTIKDTDNYVWKASGKSATKYVLAEDIPAPESVRVSDSEVDIGWQMLPYAIVVTQDMWSVSKEKDAKLNVAIPTGMEAEISYNYYESRSGGTPLSELSNGASVWASAVLTGADAENGNVVFADSGINETGTRVAHTVVIPKSGFAAAASTALNFVKKNWLWFAIGGGIFLFLLLLIIILAATRRRRKEKAEERKLEKERKAEEKARKDEERRLKEEQREEEKRKREQEREEAKAKAEAERELQKAKAEAELAKMRAEMGMVGAGAMAMQAMQPQQQPMQPMQQQAMPQQQMQMPQQPQYPQMQQPMPQPYYPQAMPDMNSAAMFAKIEAELAELRADRRQAQQAAYGPMPNYQSAGSDPAMLAKMEAEFVKMQAKQEASQEVSAAKMELEFMKMRAGYPSAMPMQQLAGAQQQGLLSMPNQAANGNFTTQQVGEIMAAMMRNMNAPQTPLKEPKEVIEAESKPTGVDTPTVYPPDAVITTTTTVDTTKKPNGAQPQRITRDGGDSAYFDIDGFYDTFEENK